MASPSREEIDAKLSATEARIEAAMAHMLAKVDHLPSTWVLVTSVIGGVVAALGLSISVQTFGGDKFDSGAQIAISLSNSIMETRALTDENARQIKAVSDQLDTLPGKLLDEIEKRNKAETKGTVGSKMLP